MEVFGGVGRKLQEVGVVGNKELLGVVRRRWIGGGGGRIRRV